MLEGLLLALLSVVGIVLLLGGLILLPFLLLGLLFKALFFLVLLPFRLLGLLFGVLFAVGAVLFKVLFVLLAVVLGAVVLAGGAVMIPFVPLLLLGLGIWLVVRLVRPRPQVVRA